MQLLWQAFCDSRKAAVTGITIIGKIGPCCIADSNIFAIFAIPYI
jgi:hypothetical protein